MPGLFGGGQPATYSSPATSSYGGHPNYIPANQPGADVNYNNIVNSLLGTGFANIGAYAGPVTQYGNQQQTAAQQIQNQAVPQYQQSAGNAYTLGAQTLPLIQAGQAGYGQLQPLTSQLIGSAFDPQQALYQQLVNQQTQASNAANAAAGVSGPYAAANTSQNLNNLAINWQNQQLGREVQGANAAGGNVLNSLNALIGGVNAGGNAATTGQGLFDTTASNYFNQAGLGNNAISNTLSTFNNLYTLPQQTLNDLQSYLGLGQAASGLAQSGASLGLQGGNLGLNQLSSGLGGLGLGGGLLANSLGVNPLQTGSLLNLLGGGGADAAATSAGLFSGVGGAGGFFGDLGGLTDLSLLA